MRNRIAACCLAPALAASLPLSASADPVLRAVFEGDLKIVAPNSSGAYVTRNFLNLTYDSLIDQDSVGNLRPQMLEGWDVSPDGLTYTFKLRDGLSFHDGTRVTAGDCVASIRRWMLRESIGKVLAARTGSLVAAGEDTFVLTLSKPFAHVIKALSRNLWIMPVRLAVTDPSKPFSEEMGSGPFIMKQDEWVPGDKVVLVKNKAYKPRSEPANGLAGGKMVNLDRLELRVINDHATRIAAIQKGEIDFIERPSMDYISLLRKDRTLTVDPMGGRTAKVGWILINQQQPPFDNVLVRRALQYAIDSTEIMAALGYPAEFADAECRSVFGCGTISPFSSNAGAEDMARANLDKAKALLKEAGYKGEKVVSLHTTNVRTIEIPATIIEEQLRAAGFNIEVAPGEWNTVFAKSYSKEPVANGGWSILVEHIDAIEMADPLINPFISGNCSDLLSGWVCDQDVKAAYTAYLDEPDADKRRELATVMQSKYMANAYAAIWGQIVVPMVYRSVVSGVLPTGLPIMWNLQKSKD